jgi:signal transduction histidine kinase
MSCTPHGQLVRVNATLRRWLGADDEGLLQSWYDVFTAPGLLFFEMQLRPLLALGRTVDGAFVTLRHRDGSTLPVLLNAQQGEDGVTIELALLMVREREQYEAALRKSQADAEAALAALTASVQGKKMQAVGQMAAGIAHEFNNLLAVVRGNIHFAQQGASESAPYDMRLQDDLTNALTATERAVAIVRQLLAFTGRHIVRRATVDLNEVVRDTAELVTPALGRDITWNTRLEPALWPVFASSDELQHAFTSLVLNARDAIRETGVPGLLTLTTENVPGGTADTDRVRCIVEDTGAGMSAEVLMRAFDPFFTTREPGQGVGLGLSMVYGTVTALGGDVKLESTEGSGTRVILTLPRARH